MVIVGVYDTELSPRLVADDFVEAMYALTDGFEVSACEKVCPWWFRVFLLLVLCIDFDVCEHLFPELVNADAVVLETGDVAQKIGVEGGEVHVVLV